MNLEFEHPKPTRYSAYKIDTNIEKFVGLKRSYSTYKDLEEKEFTKEEYQKLESITKLFENQINKLIDNNSFQFKISCQICMNSYNEKINCPKMLRCGHTLCLKCLNIQLQRKQCPICRIPIFEQTSDLIPSNFLILDEIQKFNQQKAKNIGIHCESHPDQEIIFYDEKYNLLICSNCIYYKRRAQFQVNTKHLLTSQELYQKLHRFWKQNAKKALQCQRIIEYNRCQVFNHYVKAKNAAITLIEDKAKRTIEQINQQKDLRIQQVKQQCREYQKEYQIYKFKQGKYEKQEMAKVCKLRFPCEHAIQIGYAEQFIFYCTELKYLLNHDVLKHKYHYGRFMGRHEKIDAIANADFIINQISVSNQQIGNQQ